MVSDVDGRTGEGRDLASGCLTTDPLAGTTEQSKEPTPESSCYWVTRPRILGEPSMEDEMLYWALVFFIIAIVAAIFGFGGVAATASSIAQILFFIFLVIFLITLVMGVAGRRRPPI